MCARAGMCVCMYVRVFECCYMIYVSNSLCGASSQGNKNVELNRLTIK